MSDLKLPYHLKPKASGFTLVELLVISPIVMAVTVGAVSFLFSQFVSLVKQSAQINLQLEGQTILFGLQDDLWYSNQFASDLNSNLVDAYQPSGGWTYNTSPQTLIVSSAALTTNRRNINRQAVYVNQSTCTPVDGNGVNSVLYNNVIYFVNGSNLYKRVVSAPTSLALCGTPYQKQTCPAASVSPTCPVDFLLTSHLSTDPAVPGFTVTYYDTSNTVTTIPEIAESVSVKINLKDKAAADDISASSSMRIRKLNQ